jgi:hypothetical protein
MSKIFQGIAFIYVYKTPDDQKKIFVKAGSSEYYLLR